MKLKAGRRVYMPSTKTFGTIVREGGILGLASSYAIVDDVGKRSVFVGDNIDFVDVGSSKKLDGNEVEIPPDVVPTLKARYCEKESRQMTQDLYKTNLEDRENACHTLNTLMQGSGSGQGSGQGSEQGSEQGSRQGSRQGSKQGSRQGSGKSKETSKSSKTKSSRKAPPITTEDKRPETRRKRNALSIPRGQSLPVPLRHESDKL